MAQIDSGADDDLEVEEEQEEEAPYVTFDIAAYPSDLTLSVVHEMWKDGSIVIPEFQRNFVWNIRQASLLIESFLLGLPVPQVFFHVDEENRNQVIDGQQRISSVVFFLEGYFGPENQDNNRKVFRLQGLSSKSPYYNRRFDELDEVSQRKFRSAVLRAINIRQLQPKGSASSVYHIFERLNTGGTPLKPQEIRNCVYRGELITHLRKLNELVAWRDIIGKSVFDRHQKDVELVLRVFSLWAFEERYEKPMKAFLNSSMDAEKAGNSSTVRRFLELFPKAASVIRSALGPKPCHLRGRLNSSALDALFLVVLKRGAEIPSDFVDRYDRLTRNDEFRETTHVSTSDVAVVRRRIALTEEMLFG